MEQLEPLLHAIAAVARGDDTPRPQVEAILVQLEALGFHLAATVEAIWAGQRDPAVLTADLDATDTALAQSVLALLSVKG
jgi:hypothetical protein